jgi:hypothetical protein
MPTPVWTKASGKACSIRSQRVDRLATSRRGSTPPSWRPDMEPRLSCQSLRLVGKRD